MRHSIVFVMILVLPALLFAKSEIVGLDSSQVLKADPNYLAKNYFLMQIGIVSAPSISTMMDDAFPSWDISGAGGLLLLGGGYGFYIKNNIHIEPRMKVVFTKIEKVYESYGTTKESGFLVFSIGTSARYTLKSYSPSLYVQAELRLDYPSGLEDIVMKSRGIGSGFGIGYIFTQRSIEFEIGYSTLLVNATSDNFTDKPYNFGGIYFALNLQM